MDFYQSTHNLIIDIIHRLETYKLMTIVANCY